MSPDSIESVREEIRGIDMEIIRLISERTKLAETIGRAKKEKGLGLKDAETEKKVISRFAAEGEKMGLDPEIMKKIASLLIEQALEAEEKS